jgi:hypothetical protein
LNGVTVREGDGELLWKMAVLCQKSQSRFACPALSQFSPPIHPQQVLDGLRFKNEERVVDVTLLAGFNRIRIDFVDVFEVAFIHFE